MKNSIKTFIVSLLCIVLFVQVEGASNDSDKIIGIYWSPKKDGKIEIYKRSNKYFGKIIAGSKVRKDTKNPNSSLRNRDVIGMEFLTDFVYKDGEYIDGEIYDPESGKTYSCNMWLEKGNLKVRGYIGISLLGRTETFEKIN